MPETMTFYFDFSSPYGFLASQKIDELARAIGRKVVWRPYLIGIVYKTFGGAPVDHPLKKAYMLMDFARSARLAGLADANFPPDFPASPVTPSRVFYWLESIAPDSAADFARAAFRACWLGGRGVSDPEAAIEVASALGFERAAIIAGMQEPAVKDRLRHETEAAIAQGIFGSPVIQIDGEAFWGFDRFGMIEAMYRPR
ncbi:MAG: 2-hydroxychromene-2-carboxylate isomerase [Sphingomonadales bacterium]|nr:2-hydroxychromene-2-carboxylate isomerase [Sphingomonadales bacterium]MDE2170303.1 2-hydroxychromene-2-carboxylate isomerase [Sphingomonadales bacterium]